jgi:hypothetical protein
LRDLEKQMKILEEASGGMLEDTSASGGWREAFRGVEDFSECNKNRREGLRR